MPTQQSLSPALHPLLTFTLALLYTLLIFSYPPPRHRIPAYILFCIPTTHAFLHHQHATPWSALNDTFGRMLYMWAAHVSYAFLIARVQPVGSRDGEELEGWKERVRWAGKVLYTRRLGWYYPRWGVSGRARDECDGVTRTRFFFHHASRAVFCFLLVWLSDTYTYSYAYAVTATPSSYPTHSLLRRIPHSLTADDLALRAAMTYDTCIADMLYFSGLYSAVALLRVLVLRLDTPAEWTRPLFGTPADCWTVRRYWGVYWHDFIHESFCAHAKLVTRRVLGWENGGVLRRVSENSLVFAGSGIAHAVVRYVQTRGEGEVCAVAGWYAAQMVPICLEGVVQCVWGRAEIRMRVEGWLGEGLLGRVERACGYVWVFAWMFWSVPKYLLLRQAWEMESLSRKYPGLFGVVVEHGTATVS